MDVVLMAGTVAACLLGGTLGHVLWAVLRPRFANRWACAAVGVAIGWSVIGAAWALTVAAMSL